MRLAFHLGCVAGFQAYRGKRNSGGRESRTQPGNPAFKHLDGALVAGSRQLTHILLRQLNNSGARRRAGQELRLFAIDNAHAEYGFARFHAHHRIPRFRALAIFHPAQKDVQLASFHEPD